MGLNHDGLALADMARRDWVLFERDHELGWIIEAICATAGFTPSAAVRTAQISGAPALAAVGASSADGAALELAGIGERGWEQVAGLVEAGTALWPELPPQASSQCAGPDVAGQADTLLRPWRTVGLPAEGLRDVVLLAAAPPEGATPDSARGALAGLVRAAGIVAERAEG